MAQKHAFCLMARSGTSFQNSTHFTSTSECVLKQMEHSFQWESWKSKKTFSTWVMWYSTVHVVLSTQLKWTLSCIVPSNCTAPLMWGCERVNMRTQDTWQAGNTRNKCAARLKWYNPDMFLLLTPTLGYNEEMSWDLDINSLWYDALTQLSWLSWYHGTGPIEQFSTPLMGCCLDGVRAQVHFFSSFFFSSFSFFSVSTAFAAC